MTPPRPEPPTRRPSVELPRVEADGEQDRTLYGADKQRRFDEPRRKLSQTIRDFPVPPALLETSVTAPAPKLESATLRAPTPASGVPLPPPSERPEQAVEEALRRRIAAEEARAEAAEARAKALEIEAAAKGAATETVRPDGSARSLRAAQAKVLLAVAALLGAVALPLHQYIQALRAQVERNTAQAAQATNVAEQAKAEKAVSAKEHAALEQQFRQYRSNMRELMRLQGIEVPAHDGDPAPQDLKPYAPLCPAGKVCSGPQLIITRPP